MSSTSPRARRRWLPLSIGLAVLAVLVLWWASGFILANVLERQLRQGGWPEARVEHASLALPNVVFDRIRFTADETLVAEDVRARVGSGIERIAVGMLHAEVGISDDGDWVLPGGGSSDGDSVPLDILPPDGIAVDRADIRVATPLGMIPVTLVDVAVNRVGDRAQLSGSYALRLDAADAESARNIRRESETRGEESSADGADAAVDGENLSFAFNGRATAELGADRSAQVRLRIDDGEVAANGIEAARLTGDAAGAFSAGGAASLEIAVETAATQAAGIELGALAIAGTWRDEAVRLAVTTPRPGAAEVSIEGEAVLAGEASTATLAGRVLLTAASRAQGLVTFDAALEPPPARDGGERVRGRVRIDGRDLAYPGLFAGGALDLAADLQASSDSVRLAVSDARAEAAPVAGVLPALARELENATVTVELNGEGDRPPTLQWRFADQSAELVGRLEARAGDARVATALRLETGTDAEADLSGFTARNLPWGDLLLGADSFDGTIVLAPEEWRIEGAGTLLATGKIASVGFDAATVSWAGTVTGTPQRVVLSVEDCMEWRAAAVDVGGKRIAEPAPLCVAPADDGVLLSYELDEDRSDFAFSIGEQPLAFRLVTDDGPYAVEGLWPSLAVSGETNAAGIATLSARLSGGALSSPEAGVAVQGITGTADLRDGALTSTALRVTRIESLATPAPIAPVGLELTAERAGDSLSFDAILSDDLGTFVLEAVGSQQGDHASAAIRLHPVRFVSGATEVADLSPLLAEHMSDASGALELAGDVEWSGSELTGSGLLSVREFGATVAGIRVSGLSTETRLTSLVPPVTAPEQTVEVAEVNLGMPLEDGLAVFDLDADGTLAFQRVEFGFAGGRLYAEPFTIDSGSVDDIGFVLRAEAVELSHFLELSQIEGLAGTGVLSGRVPVRLADGGIRLDEGLLAAETDGVLRYTPNDLPDFLRGDDVRSRMLREVLTNFQYEELSLAVSGESTEGGQQRLTLSARGANPDFLEGHPIELSFNFQGPLLGAVRSAVDLSDAAQLEQIFEQRETENEENSR